MPKQTWLAVKTTLTRRFRVKLIFGSPHAILNNYRHISRRLKSNLKCFFIGKIHCVERWRSKWIITRYEQRSFVVASFFASTCTFYGPCPAFLAISGPWMMRSSQLLQESSELWFRFRLHNFGTKCLPKVNLRRAAGYVSPFRWSIQDSNRLWSFFFFCYRQFSFKIFACNHFSTE